jgi:UTP--glucose-1-phosphate uridylyltransferase
MTSKPNSIKKVRKAVFPVAGMGTRLLPATKVMPKEMLTLVDKPLIQHAVEEAMSAGIEEFIFVTAPGKEMLEHHFSATPTLTAMLEKRGKADLLQKLAATMLAPGTLATVIQPEALGFGHAIWCARDLVGDEPFAILLPDDVFLPGASKRSGLKTLVDSYHQLGGNLCIITEVPREETARYGILDISSDDGVNVAIKGMVEKPKPEQAPSNLSIMGRYILQPEIFALLSRHEIGAGGEIQLTDAMAKLIGVQPFHGVRYDGKRYDCGTKLGFAETNLAFALSDPEIGAMVRAQATALLK